VGDLSEAGNISYLHRFGGGLCLGITRGDHSVDLKLFDLITSQLDRELIFHNTIMAGHKKRVDDILQKGRELLEASSSLRRMKIELEETPLGRLLELQKALEEVSDLQEKMDSA